MSENQPKANEVFTKPNGERYVIARIAVLVNDKGHYAAQGISLGNCDHHGNPLKPTTQEKMDQQMCDWLPDTFDRVSDFEHTHIKFIEVEVPLPSKKGLRVEDKASSEDRVEVELNEF